MIVHSPELVFEVAYDVRHHYGLLVGYHMAVPLAFVLFAALMAARAWRRRRDPAWRRFRRHAIIATIFALLPSILWGITLAEQVREIKALERGDCNVIEGIVTEYRPHPKSGHQFESFVVEGKRFENAGQGLVGQGLPVRGIVHEGMQVRVYYDGEAILRLETAGEQGGAPPPARRGHLRKMPSG